jgi:hypothetical protein
VSGRTKVGRRPSAGAPCAVACGPEQEASPRIATGSGDQGPTRRGERRLWAGPAHGTGAPSTCTVGAISSRSLPWRSRDEPARIDPRPAAAGAARCRRGAALHRRQPALPHVLDLVEQPRQVLRPRAGGLRADDGGRRRARRRGPLLPVAGHAGGPGKVLWGHGTVRDRRGRHGGARPRPDGGAHLRGNPEPRRPPGPARGASPHRPAPRAGRARRRPDLLPRGGARFVLLVVPASSSSRPCACRSR